MSTYRLFRPDSPHIAFLLPDPPAESSRAVSQGFAAYRKRDHWGAFSAWKAAADTNDIEACFLTGTMYALGQGIPQDFDQALRYLHRATSHGHGPAAFNAGLLSQHSPARPFSQDIQPTTAIAYFRLAAEAMDDPRIHERAQRICQAIARTLPEAYEDQVRRVMNTIMRPVRRDGSTPQQKVDLL